MICRCYELSYLTNDNFENKKNWQRINSYIGDHKKEIMVHVY